MKVSELKGYKSMGALNAFNALLLGMKMLPMHSLTPYEKFHEDFKTMDYAEKESMIRQAIAFVQLEQVEVEALVTFCSDKNGVPYNSASLKSMDLKTIHEVITAVCMKVGEIKIDLLSEEEKKKYQTSQLISDQPSQDIQT